RPALGQIVKAGGTAGCRVIDLSSCRRTRGRFDSAEVIDMADKAKEPNVAAAAEAAPTTDAPDAEILEAPERGSVDELLDAGAHDELDAMRHSTAHVMAEAVLDMYPATKLG